MVERSEPGPQHRGRLRAEAFDPAHVLGLDLGDAPVIRNVGGRVTPATLAEAAG